MWRKLAETYNTEHNTELVICTFEEGLKYIPVSSDLWLHYCIWKTENSSPDEARELFVRATQASGRVYTSFLLWDKYLDFEKALKNTEGIEKIFYTLMSFPNSKLFEYYTRFKNFLDTQYKDNEEVRKKKKDEAVLMYEKVFAENNKRKVFEQGIKRSNFSNKPLDLEQIQNWRRYLEFEETEGNTDRIRLLYERCIVPCSYYAEFWIRYAKYLEKLQGFDSARNLYQRANKDFLSKRPDLFVAQGYYEEMHGNIQEARKLYTHAYENIAPGLIDGIIKHAHLERREKNTDQSDELFQYALEVSFNSGDSGCILYVTGEYAKFHLNTMKNVPKALNIYKKSLEKIPEQKSLYYLYISAIGCIENPEEKLEKIKEVFEIGIGPESKLLASDQLELWVSYMDFVRRFWGNFEEIKEIEKRFRKQFHHQNMLTLDFKNRCGIKRMKKNDRVDYPEPVKSLPK